MQHWEWDQDDEQEKERRLQERRQRVQERLAAQKAAGTAGGEGGGSGDAAAGKGSRGKHEVALSLEVVKQLRQACDGVVTAVRDEAERREEAQADQWEQQVNWLKEEIATEAEACKGHARAIDLEWEGVHNAATPQAAAEAMAAVQRHCEQVLQSKEDLLSGIRGVLRERDEAYMKLLQGQTEETDKLIALMAQEYDKLKRGQEQALEAVEAAYLQERSELISAQKLELDSLLEKRSALEQSFLDQYLKACEAYEVELEAMKAAEAQEYITLKRRLEAEVASLEAHLDAMHSVYILNADKLHYNVRVLSERERENKEALQQQKRKITRQWEVLSKLKKRYAAMDKRFTEENLKLAEEYQRITRAFNHLQSKYRHFKGADLARFAKIRAMKEEEMDALAEQLAEVDAAIRLHVLGLVEGVGGSQTGAIEPPGIDAGEQGGEEEGGSSGDQLRLAVVGRALSRTTEAGEAGAAAGAHLQDEESEVVVLSAEAAAARVGLIAAYRPSGAATGGQQQEQVPGNNIVASGEAGMSSNSSGDGIELVPLAWQELRESLEAGMLSLLVAGNGRNSRDRSSSSSTRGAQLDGGKVQQMLAQLPEAAPGRWEAACVARSLGVQHEVTLEALQALFCGSASSSPTVQVGEQVPEAAGEAASSRSAGSLQGAEVVLAASTESSARLVGAEQLQHGIQRLLGMLQADDSGHSRGAASPALPAGRPASRLDASPEEIQGQLQHEGEERQKSSAGSASGAEPTSAAYWQRRVEAVLAQESLQAWAGLEPQLTRQFKLLQLRAKTAEEMAALKSENEVLKARLKELLTSPTNDEMQLPTRILLE